MGGRTCVRPPAGPPRGVLASTAPDGAVEHRRLLPPADLAPFIAHFWSVRWSLRAPFTAETLPHPTVHVVLERQQGGESSARIGGVPTRRFVKRLEGEGRVFGIKFRAAAFQPSWGVSMEGLRDRVLPVEAVFGAPGAAWAAACIEETELDRAIATSCAFLRGVLPTLPPEVERARDLVERMAVDRALLRVDHVVAHAGLGIRALQRSFRRFVGVTPKWVLERYRLHEAAEQLKATPALSIARLAASLGYADQAHFARAFRRLVGRSPREVASASPGAARAPASSRDGALDSDR